MGLFVLSHYFKSGESDETKLTAVVVLKHGKIIDE